MSPVPFISNQGPIHCEVHQQLIALFCNAPYTTSNAAFSDK